MKGSASSRLVLVTGAASGIGRAVCTLLAQQGEQVIGVDQDPLGLSSLQKELGNALIAEQMDITQVDQWSEQVEHWEAQWAPIEALVYAAGKVAPGRLCDPELSQDSFRSAFDIHVTGLWGVARAVSQGMQRRRRGSIVAITSNAGSTPRLNMGAYPPSKAAAIMLIQCLALELGPSGVRVNSVAPGSTDTPMLQRLLGGHDSSALVAGDLSTFRTGIPLQRVASPHDIAQAVRFLLSDEARHITGTNLKVDGGATWS